MKLSILVVALVGIVSQVLILSILELTGVLDPFVPLVSLFEVTDVTYNNGFENLGGLFVIWNYLTFSLSSSNSLFVSPIDLSYVLFLIVFLVSLVIATRFAKSKGEGLVGVLLMILLQIGLALLVAQFIPGSIDAASLPPQDQELITNLGRNLSILTVSPLIGAYILGFLINVGIAFGLGFLLSKKSK